jgi:hypothetical protein
VNQDITGEGGEPDGRSGGPSPDFVDQALAERKAKEREAAKTRAIRRATRPPPSSGELSADRKRHIALKCLGRAADRLAATPEGTRDTDLGKTLLDVGKFVNESCLSRDEVSDAITAAAYANGLDRDVGNGGIAKVQKDVDRVLDKAAQRGMAVEWDRFEWLARDYDGAGGFAEDGAARATPPPLVELEDGFWTQRDSLTDIYTAALARMCSPWAVLGVCAAKVLAMVPPTVVLPPLIGGKGSLNWFCALAALSGGGKNAALDVADDLIKQPVLRYNVGSGEGMVEAYRRPKNTETGEPAGQHQSIMFVADEIDTMAALKNRNGSTLAAMLRSAFTATTLGFTTKASNSFHLKRHDYRLTLVVGVQPARAGTILDDAGAGTPQRIMWFPATDARVSVDRPYFPGELSDIPSYGSSDKWRYGAELEIPDEARRAVEQARASSQRGEGDPLDTHALFVREKFAYALAVLDGRDQMNSQDWVLAGVAMKVSDHTRQWVMAQRELAEDEQAIQDGRLLGVRRAAADDEQAHREATRRNRITRGVVAKFTAAGAGGLSDNELVRQFASRDRRLVKPILTSLVDKKVLAKGERKAGDRTDRWVIVPDD